MHKGFRNLLIIDTFWSFVYGLAAPFITIYFNNFGSIKEVGLSVAIMYIIQGLLCFGAGKVLERIKPKKVLLFSQIAEGLRIFLFVLAKNVYWVYAIQFIGGITRAFITPAYSELLVKVSKKESGMSFGERSGLNMIALGLSALISGVLISYFGYTPIFVMWGFAEIVYGTYIYYMF